jgi:hypothetical protein
VSKPVTLRGRAEAIEAGLRAAIFRANLVGDRAILIAFDEAESMLESAGLLSAALAGPESGGLAIVAKARAVTETLDWPLQAGYDSPDSDRMLAKLKERIADLAAVLPK